MGSEAHPVHNNGIYHNLPTFDPNVKNLNAIVTGANGISGYYMMRALLDAPDRWAKVYALSRRPPPKEMLGLLSSEQRARVQHVACDFLESPDKIAEAIKSANVQADYVFFYSYLQPNPPPGEPLWSNAEELTKVNTALLDNFLQALPKAGIQPKRFVLQTGAKNYGIHIGRCRMPAIESDPQPKELQSNFYYPQEDLLTKFCKDSGGKTGWNVMRPAWIIGAVNNAAMSALHPFAIYAAVQAHKGEPLTYFGDWASWQEDSWHSTARQTGYLTEWAVLEDKCKDEAFNSVDGGPFSWDRFYEELARWYGAEKGVVPPSEDESKYNVITGASGKDTPMGYGPPMITKVSDSFVRWAKEPANHDVWKELMKQSGGKLMHDPFEDPEAHFTCGDLANIKMSFAMNKARRLGWTGFVDTMESVFEMYHDMAALGMLPPMKVDKPKALV